MRIPARWFVEPITVEPHAGQGAYGDTYGQPVVLLGHLVGGRRLQRASIAEEVVSQRQVMFPNPARQIDPDTREVLGTVDPAQVLTPESRVTAGTVVATVSQVTPHVQPGTGRVVYVSGELT